MLAAFCVFGLFAVVCAVIGSRLHRVSSSRVEGREAWRHAEGEVFERPQWFFPLVVGGIILNGFLALVVVGAFITVGMNFISIVLLIPVLVGAYIFYLSLRMRGSPLAIVQADGIVLPRHHCPYIAWKDIEYIRAYATHHSALLSFKVKDPASIQSQSASWKKSGTDTVLLGIFDTGNPVVRAAKAAHENWFRISGLQGDR